MNIQRMAAFSYRGQGGNPAGVALCDHFPHEIEMQSIAKSIGYSETAFLKLQKGVWRIRYFAPEMEVPFCGHATIASGAVLGARFGAGKYQFELNDGSIDIEVNKDQDGSFSTILQSPNTWSAQIEESLLKTLLRAFSLSLSDLDKRFPVRIAYAGARHVILALRSRELLAQMAYQFEVLERLMREQEWLTINLIWVESQNRVHSRNAGAVAGIYEDAATGSAAAALGGYFRDINFQNIASPGDHCFEVIQGEDMGLPSRLNVEYSATPGEGVSVGGETHLISETD